MAEVEVFTFEHKGLVRGLLDFLKSATGFLQEATYAAQAYSRVKVLELKVQEHPEVQQLRLEVALIELKDKKRALDHQRSVLLTINKDLEARIQRKKSELYGAKTAPVPVKADLRDGTKTVKSQPPRRKREDKILTHHMDLSKVTNATEAKAEEKPIEAQAT